MKNLITAVAALAALVVGPALAADMPVKAPIAPAPVVTWTGGYVGLGLGGQWASTKWTTTCFSDVNPLSATGFGTCENPDPIFDQIDRSSPHTFDASGFRGSFYGGWNLQTGSAVVGFEFDFGLENPKSTLAGIPGCIVINGCGHDDSTWIQMQYDGSFRARAGFLATPEVLIYATGGGAFQSFKANVNCAVPSNIPTTGFFCATAGGSSETSTPFGWTGGGGLEYKAGQFIFRGEYRYSDYGSTDVSFFQPDQSLSQGIHAKLHLTTQIAYFGISYLWGPITGGGRGGGGGGYGGAGE